MSHAARREPMSSSLPKRLLGAGMGTLLPSPRHPLFHGAGMQEGIPSGSPVVGFTPQVTSLRLEKPPPAGTFGFKATMMFLSAIEGKLRLEGAGSWRCDVAPFLLGRREERRWRCERKRGKTPLMLVRRRACRPALTLPSVNVVSPWRARIVRFA